MSEFLCQFKNLPVVYFAEILPHKDDEHIGKIGSTNNISSRFSNCCYGEGIAKIWPLFIYIAESRAEAYNIEYHLHEAFKEDRINNPKYRKRTEWYDLETVKDTLNEYSLNLELSEIMLSQGFQGNFKHFIRMIKEREEFNKRKVDLKTWQFQY